MSAYPYGGRPATLTGPLVSVTIERRTAAGEIEVLAASWCDGTIKGDGELVSAARAAAAEARMVPVSWFAEATADLTTPLGAIAAMVALDPGSARVERPIPPELEAYLLGQTTEVPNV